MGLVIASHVFCGVAIPILILDCLAPSGLPDETGDDVAMTDPRPASPAALQNLTDLIQSLRCGECHPDCMLGIVASLPQQGF